MSELFRRIQDDMKAAMKARDGLKTSTLRMAYSALKNEKIALRKDLTDQDVIRVLQKGVRSRREAVDLYRQGGREDLAAKEEAEIEILQSYLPKELSPQEIEEEAAKLIQELGLESPKQLGLFMRAFMERFQGRADGKAVQQVARKLLGS